MNSSAKRATSRSSAMLLLSLALGLGYWVACSDTEEPSSQSTPDQSAESEPAKGPGKRGRFVSVQPDGLTDEQRENLEGLEDLGYTAGIDQAPELIGVTRHNKSKTTSGLNILTSAHAASAQLMDMEGKILHEWSYPFRKVWPNHPRMSNLSTYWRRTKLLENGDLLAIYEGQGIIKISANSELIWKNPVRAHHDLEVMPDGSIYVLTRVAHKLPRINTEKFVLEDFVTVLDPDGNVKQQISLLEAIEHSEFNDIWNKTTNWDGDLFHTNSMRVLDGSIADQNPAFAKGNVLLSMLLLDLVAVLDPETETIVWASKGTYHYQHDARVLPSGMVMIFDNQGAGEKQSRILELDPASWETTWSYEGSAKQPFYSETCGLAQRLPDGNTLITESDRGRAFEISPEGGTVWEYYNPNRAGDKQQYIAAIMEVLRLPAEFPLDWLESAE